MSITAISTINAVIAVVFLLVLVGILIWVAVQAKSPAKSWAIGGLSSLIASPLLGMGVTALTSTTGNYSWLLVNALLTGLLQTAGIVLLVMAFLRTDAVAARFQRGGGHTAGPQDQSFGAPPVGPGQGHGRPSSPTVYPGVPHQPGPAQRPAWPQQ